MLVFPMITNDVLQRKSAEREDVNQNAATNEKSTKTKREGEGKSVISILMVV